MSVAGYSDPDRMFNKTFPRRNDSGELDVFEAARYFSGYDTGSAYYNCATFSQRIMRDERQQQLWRGGRVSLDVPMRHHIHPIVQPAHAAEKQNKEKKHKQPSSPGGKLASFLNSLFNQASSKKKKSMKDEEESPAGRRKRRISISHFRSSSTADTKSFYSSSDSGFRTPPSYAHTPAKSYNDFKSYLDHKQQVASSMSKNNTGQTKPTDRYQTEKKDYMKFGDADNGADSDSSSDLFELQNYDIGIYSSGLPVYETTHVDSIKRGAPISNGAP
ncbi:BIG GRAIN LIKE 1 [Hibiscus trionum]|uniref:BIG GRAIN LIKE 1 n=1 Tax=Hibiscus trionum TaxID=183268 RepID=A0A9W7ML67_HIBTR|nr:BIG GRAIN LIKE 1 [Hibiscus trionum]